MWDKIKNIPKQTWQWLSGKKRWIAITAGLIAKLLPEHTFGHQVGAFIKDNADTIFYVAGFTAIGEVAVQKAKQKLPDGIKNNAVRLYRKMKNDNGETSK